MKYTGHTQGGNMHLLQRKNEIGWELIDTYDIRYKAEKELTELKAQFEEFENRFNETHEVEYRIITLTPGYYMADTFYGVSEFDFIDYPEAEIMPCKDFYENLDTVTGEIFAYFDYGDLDLLFKIWEKYGIWGC